MREHRNNWALVLLLPPFVGLLWPPFYAHLDPRWIGLPFFLWYQFAWVIVTGLLTGLVYRLRRVDTSGRSSAVTTDASADGSDR